MYFAIQACSPAVNRAAGVRVAGLAGAIQAAFPLLTEDAILVWNHVPVRLGYRYDLSVMADDLLPLLADLLRGGTGAHRVYWPSSSFMVDWALEWSGDALAIDSRWDTVSGGYEAVLNARARLEISRDAFLREWKVLLRRLSAGIEQSGVRLRDEAGLRELRRIESAIPGPGRRYDAPEDGPPAGGGERP